MKQIAERRFFYSLLSLVYISAVSFLFLEIALRVFDPIGIEHFFEAPRYFDNMTTHSAFGYIHTAGYQDTLLGVDVSINSHGFRGPEFKVAKPDGMIRILILGDSIVFGWGAPQESIFPVVLQNLLDEDKHKIEVIGAGVGSWNTRIEYEFLRIQGIEYQPDIVVLVICSNDVQPKRIGHTYVDHEELFPEPRSVPYWQYLSSRMWGAAVRRLYVLSTVHWFINKRVLENRQLYSEQSPQWKDARMALKGIVEVCRARHIHLLAYLHCVPEIPHHKLYASVLRSEQVPFFSLPLQLYDKQYRNSIVDSHPNASGHRVIAEKMFKALQPILAKLM